MSTILFRYTGLIFIITLITCFPALENLYYKQSYQKNKTHIVQTPDTVLKQPRIIIDEVPQKRKYTTVPEYRKSAEIEAKLQEQIRTNHILEERLEAEKHLRIEQRRDLEDKISNQEQIQANRALEERLQQENLQRLHYKAAAEYRRRAEAEARAQQQIEANRALAEHIQMEERLRSEQNRQYALEMQRETQRRNSEIEARRQQQIEADRALAERTQAEAYNRAQENERAAATAQQAEVERQQALQQSRQRALDMQQEATQLREIKLRESEARSLERSRARIEREAAEAAVPPAAAN